MYRLIIADDEMIECMVLEHIVQHEMSDQIEVLDSVQDGIALLEAVEEQKPDIAIVDINMPGLGGLDAIELLQAKQIKLKIIIHSAYSEFSYAQRALQLGAADYLVKPNLKEEIVASIKKICRMLEAEEERKTAYVSQAEAQHAMQELASGRWMMSLLLEQPDAESYRRVRNGFPDALSGGIFTVWEAAESENTPEKVSEKMEQEIFANLENRLASLCSHVCLRHENVLYCLLFPGKKVRSGDWKAWLSELIRCVGSGREKAGDDPVPWIVGVSTWKEENDFLSGLHEAQAALWHRSQSGIFFYQENELREQGSTGKSTQGQKDCFSPETDKRLAGYVLERREEEGAKELLQMIRRIPVPSYSSPEEKLMTCKTGAAFFLLSMEEELEKLSAKKEWAADFWKSFRDIRTQEELLAWCEEKFFDIAALFHQPAEDENPHIFHTYAFVAQNFSRDLPLEEIAQKIGISPFYLSRLLKQKKRTTFVEIVTDIRIRKAVMLLVRSRRAVREIAVSVGYPNQSYFYRVFKKTTGIAVGDIRKYLW